MSAIGHTHIDIAWLWTVEQTKEAFHLARELGYDNINMDLIVGLPGEDIHMVERTLEQVRELAPDSITVHFTGSETCSKAEYFLKGEISGNVF